MKRLLNWTWVFGLIACIVSLGFPQPTQASSIPTVTLSIRQNQVTKHYYFSPTYPCIPGMSAYVKIVNTTQKSQPFIEPTLGSPKVVAVKVKGTFTFLGQASNQTSEGAPAIIIVLNPSITNIAQEAEATITAKAIMNSPGCTQSHV